MSRAVKPLYRPEMTRSGLPPTQVVDALDEYQNVRAMQIAEERPLTIYLDRYEVVTLMTLGTRPELLTLGYLKNQGLVKNIEDIQSILASDVPFTLFPFLEVGHRVRIRGGCLDGVEGILLCKNTDRSLLVSIDLIQRSLAVRVDGFEVEPIKWNNSAGRPAEVRAF